MPQTAEEFVRNIWRGRRGLPPSEKVRIVLRSNFNPDAVVQALQAMRVPRDAILDGFALARMKPDICLKEN